MSMVDVVVLNYNDYKTTKIFLKNIESYDNIGHIVVVDNCSIDDSFSQLKRYENKKVTVIQSGRNGGYGAGNNFGIRFVYKQWQTPFVLVCNPDVWIGEDVIEKLYQFLMKNRNYAMVAPFMCDATGKKQFNTAFRIPKKYEYIFSLDIIISKVFKFFYYRNLETESREVKQVEALSGSLFLCNTEKMIKYGMYDEKIFLYCEETVLGIKLKKAKQRVALLSQEIFLHKHSVSISKTFSKNIQKQKLLINSKLYVIRKYYKANIFEYALALGLAKVSLVECFLISVFRGK